MSFVCQFVRTTAPGVPRRPKPPLPFFHIASSNSARIHERFGFVVVYSHSCPTLRESAISTVPCPVPSSVSARSLTPGPDHNSCNAGVSYVLKYSSRTFTKPAFNFALPSPLCLPLLG